MTDQRRRIDDQWHLDKRLSVSHIVATVTLLAMGAGVYIDIDNRVTRLEVTAEHTASMVAGSVNRIEGQLGDLKFEVKEQLGDLNRKFDKMLERELSKNGDRKH